MRISDWSSDVCSSDLMSCQLGWITRMERDRAIKLLQRAALPVVPPAQMKPQDFLEHMAVDKKVLDGRLRLVLLRRMGEAVVTGDFPRDVLETTLSASSGAMKEHLGARTEAHTSELQSLMR